MKKLLFITITFFFSVLFLEIGLQFISFLVNYDKIMTVDHRIKLSPYKNQKWADDLFQENKKLKPVHFPFSGWKAVPLAENPLYYQIDSLNRNRTVKNYFEKNDSTVKKVWVFGGSTIWGVYQRTEYTIPSLMAKYSYSQNKKWNIENWGQLGYIFSQNLIDLVQQLKLGNRPDYVIFYEGANDVLSTYHYKLADRVPLTEEVDAALSLRRSSYLNQIFETTKILIVENSKIYKILHIISEKLKSDSRNSNLSVSKQQKLVNETKEVYRKNIEFIDKLSLIYKFDYKIILQPILFFKEPKSEEELNLKFDPNCSDSTLKLFAQKSYQSILSLPSNEILDFSGILNQSNATVFVDLVHVSEQSNEIIASEIVKMVNMTSNYKGN